MSKTMDDNIKRWATKRKTALVLAQPLGLLAMHGVVKLGDEMLKALVGFPECIALTQHGQHSFTLVFQNGRQG